MEIKSIANICLKKRDLKLARGEFVSLALRANVRTLWDLVESHKCYKIKTGFQDAMTALTNLCEKQKQLYFGISWQGLAVDKAAAASARLVDWSNS